MKNFYSKLMMGFLLLSTSTINAQTTYCVPSQTPQFWIDAPTRPITLIEFSQDQTVIFSKSTSANVSIETPKFEDFSSTEPAINVYRGQSYNLRMKGNTSGNNTDYITLYIDWNGDGTFSNSTPADLATQQAWTLQKEKHQHGMSLQNSTGEDNTEVNYTLNIPTDAVLGQTRIRIVKNYIAPSNGPCANLFQFGQSEDYTLNITEASTVNEVEITTQNNVPAVISTVNGTLQLVASVLPTATASQAVTWSIISGVNTVSVSSIGLVTGLINNGSAIIRATSVEDTTKFDEMEINVAVPQQAATLDFTENFETTADWTYVNQTERTTKWVIGDAVTNGTGSKALYVSNDDGTTNSTDHNIMLTVHAYRDIQIPAGTTNTELSFDWKSEGDFYDGGWGYSVYNYMEVWVVPTSYTPIGGSLITPEIDRIKIQGNHQDGNFLEQATFTTYNNSNLDLSAYAGQNVRLVFSWKNINGSAGTPAAIDNVSLKLPMTVVTPCAPVETLDENFNDFTTFPENCWNASASYPSVYLSNTDGSVTMYGGNNSSGSVYIVSPELTSISGEHALSVDFSFAMGSSQPTSTVQIGTLSDPTNFETFVAVGEAVVPTPGTYVSPLIQPTAGHKYIAIKYTVGAPHSAIIVDNVKLVIPNPAAADKFDKDKVKIYPNPTTGMFFIETDIDVKSIEIYNTSGQRILKTNQKNINLENAVNGLYIVNVNATDGTHASYKIIKK